MDEKIVEEVKAALEVSLEQVVEKAADPIIDLLLKEVALLIPGGVDDAIIAAMAPQIKKLAKELVLAEIEKISAKV